MIFPERKARLKKNLAMALTLVVALLIIVAHGKTNDAGRSMPLAPATAGSTVVAESAAPAKASSATLVTYDKKNYPDLKNIDYGTYTKLDYKEVDSGYTYFYDFRADWRAGARRLEEAETSLVRDRQG